MTERLLRIADIAAMLGTSHGVAASVLAGRGVLPIDFGAGRGRGRRWLLSAVVRAMEGMHEESQPRAKPAKTPRPPKASALAGMSVDQILQLTSAPRLQ